MTRVPDDRSEFSYPRPNLIVSRDGFSVEVVRGGASAVSIRYAEAGKAMEIFGEPLVSADPEIAIRRSDVGLWSGLERQGDLAEAERSRIVENIRKAFAFKGWVLVVLDQVGHAGSN